MQIAELELGLQTQIVWLDYRTHYHSAGRSEAAAFAGHIGWQGQLLELCIGWYRDRQADDGCHHKIHLTISFAAAFLFLSLGASSQE